MVHTCQHVEGDKSKRIPIELACLACRDPMNPRAWFTPGFSSDDFRLMLDGKVIAKNHSFVDLLGAITFKSEEFYKYQIITPGGARMGMKSAVFVEALKRHNKARREDASHA